VRRLVTVCYLVAVVVLVGGASASPAPLDWRTFDWNAARTGVSTVPTRITAANVKRLVRRQVALDGTVDSSPIYMHAALVHGKAHDVFFVTTTYGKTEAIDASSGAVLWRFTPPGYSSWAGSSQIATATPVIGDARTFVYAAAPSGRIYKLSVADGHVVWSVSITRLPSREKIASALNYAGGHVIATTGGYIGDAPPYQGHVAVIDAGSGRLLRVWNSLCSNRSGLLDPSSCSASDSAIWGRAGAVIDPATGDLLVATGNGPWDGATNWGDAVIRLSSDASAMRGNYTPVNTAQLNSSDTDLGSASPVILDSTHVAQGGKDGKIRVLGVSQMSGASAHKGGELQVVSTPGSKDLFTAPAVWRQSWLFVADGAGTAAFRYSGGQLTQAWANGTGGTSPVLAGGLLWVFDPFAGGLYVYRPTTGALVATLPSGSGHWNSPIVIDGRVALPEGDANTHRTSGILDIWSLR
jgi:hypothetical protein